MQKMTSIKKVPWACIVPFTLVLAACGGGGGSSSSTTTTTETSPDGETLSQDTSTAAALTIPSEISAVPASTTGSNAPARTKNLNSAVRNLAKAATATGLPATSDYALAPTSTFVDEHTLEVFSIIEQVLNAIGQTGFKDQLNTGPYKVMVAWEDEENGRPVKTLEEWIVDARSIQASKPDGSTGDVLRLLAWINETDHNGEESLIKAEFKIYTSPTEDTAQEGAYLDFGEWDMNVLFDASSTAVDTGDPAGFFVAQARVVNGVSTLKVQDSEVRDIGLREQIKGILVREGDAGYGKVQYPDWETCHNPSSGFDCSTLTEFPSKVTGYGYNDSYLAVEEFDRDGASLGVDYKDRDVTNAAEMVHRYGMYYKEAGTVGSATVAEGEDVLKQKSFGFPVTFTAKSKDDPNVTFRAFGYYGAWQGRHQLWGPDDNNFVAYNGNNASTATVFTKQDFGPTGDNAPTYYLREFAGTFTKRTLVDAELADILGVPVETWINKHFDVSFNASAGAWEYCDGFIDWPSFNPSTMTRPDCRDRSSNEIIAYSTFSSFNELKTSDGDRRWINIGYWDQQTNQQRQYVYLDSTNSSGVTGYTDPGFYAAQQGNMGRMTAIVPAELLSPTDGLSMFIDIGGAIYVQYTGEFSGPTTTTGWVQKELLSFDTSNWQPTFGSTDTAFTPERGRDYYINANGVNFVVKRTDADITNGFQSGDYDVRIELQTAAHPENTNASASVLPAGTVYLAQPWNRDVKYTLVTDPTNANYLLLVVKHDASGNSTVGAVETDDIWGLVAYNAGSIANDYTAGTGFSDDQPLDATGTAVTVDEWGVPTDPNSRPTEHNWEYAGANENWGKQRFLASVADATDYIILDDPIPLQSFTLTNLGGDTKTFSLRYDGWMHGLPELYFELQKNDWQMSDDIRNKIVKIAAGTVVTDSSATYSDNTPVKYFIKPLNTSILLHVLTDTEETAAGSSLPTINSVDLSTLPSFTAHGMGAVPTVDWDGNALVLKYSEGKPVSE